MLGLTSQHLAKVLDANTTKSLASEIDVTLEIHQATQSKTGAFTSKTPGKITFDSVNLQCTQWLDKLQSTRASKVEIPVTNTKETETLWVYPAQAQIELLPKTEVLKGMIHYLRAGAFLVTHSGLEAQTQQTFLKNLELIFKQYVYCYKDVTDKKIAAKLLLAFETAILTLLKTNKKMKDYTHKDIAYARSMVNKLSPPSSCCTIEDEGKTLCISRKFRHSKDFMEKIMPSVDGMNQNPAWLEALEKKPYAARWATQYRDDIIHAGNTADCTADWFPGGRNTQIVTMISVKSDTQRSRSSSSALEKKGEPEGETKYSVIAQQSFVRTGLLSPQEISDRKVRVHATVDIMLNLLKQTLPSILEEHLTIFSPLYEHAGNTDFVLPIHWGSFFSQLILLDLVASDNNSRYYDEISDAFAIIEQRYREGELTTIFPKEIPFSTSAEGEKANYKVTYDFFQTNNPVNSKSIISIINNRDVEDANRIVNTAVEQLQLLLTVLKDHVGQNHEYTLALQSFCSNIQDSSNISFWGIKPHWCPKEHEPALLRLIADLNAGKLTATGLSQVGQSCFARKIKAAGYLRRYRHESIFAWARRKLTNLRGIGWLFSIITTPFTLISRAIFFTNHSPEIVACEQACLSGFSAGGCKRGAERTFVTTAATKSLFFNPEHLGDPNALQQDVKSKLNSGREHVCLPSPQIIKTDHLGDPYSDFLDTKTKEVTNLIAKTRKPIKSSHTCPPVRNQKKCQTKHVIFPPSSTSAKTPVANEPIVVFKSPFAKPKPQQPNTPSHTSTRSRSAPHIKHTSTLNQT